MKREKSSWPPSEMQKLPYEVLKPGQQVSHILLSDKIVYSFSKEQIFSTILLYILYI